MAYEEHRNGIRSFEKQIEKHQQWIAEPLTKIPDFGELRSEQQRHKDSIEILKGVLQERENGNIRSVRQYSKYDYRDG